MTGDTKLRPQRRLRIALCSPEWKPMHGAMGGGAANATYIIQRDIAHGLQELGHQLTYVAPHGLHEVVCTQDPAESSVAPRTWSSSGWFRLASKAVWRAQRLLRVPYLNVFSNYSRYDACLRCLPGHDLVYERNGLYNAGVAMVCKQLGLQYVLFVEADEILEFDYMEQPILGLLRWRAKRIFRRNLRTADIVVCVSDQLKNHLVQNWHVPEEKITVFQNAVDVERFRPIPETVPGTRASLKVGGHPLSIFVGNFYKWHDVATLLDSFVKVLESIPEARLVLVGDGDHRQEMEQYARTLGITHAVRFVGFVSREEIPRLLSAADIAVAPYPSLDDELWLSPLKLYEYMASGTAIVASEAGQIVDVIEDGQNGLIVPPEDVAALTGAMRKLIGDPGLRAELGRQAREDAVHRHSWQQYLLRLERLFHTVAEGEPVSV